MLCSRDPPATGQAALLRAKMDNLVVGEDIRLEVFAAIEASAAWTCNTLQQGIMSLWFRARSAGCFFTLFHAVHLIQPLPDATQDAFFGVWHGNLGRGNQVPGLHTNGEPPLVRRLLAWFSKPFLHAPNSHQMISKHMTGTWALRKVAKKMNKKQRRSRTLLLDLRPDPETKLAKDQA